MNTRVIGSPEFNSQHELLKASAENGNGASQSLLKKTDKAIAKLKTNYRAGKHVPKDRIPPFYVINYGVENLWKLNIDPNYRLIYTIRGTDVEVMSVILEYLDHKAYSKRFGYKD